MLIEVHPLYVFSSQELEDRREEYRAAQTALEAAEREQAPHLAGLAARGTLHRDETRGVRSATEAAARALRLEEEDVAEEGRRVQAIIEVLVQWTREAAENGQRVMTGDGSITSGGVKA